MVSLYSNDDESNSWDPIPARQQAPAPYNPTQQPTAPAGQSSDASQKSTLGNMWDAWTSKPENNAAMINFGLAMMSPRSPGETGLGHFAQAVGAAGEGSTANVKAQEERETRAEASDLAERKAEVEEERGSAYSQYMRNRNTVDKIGMQQALRQQSEWNKWRNGKESQEDLLNPGMSNDTTVNRLRAETGKKGLTKSQILADPALSTRAEQIIKGQSIGGGGVSSGPQEGATATGPDGARVILRGGQWVPLGAQE